MLFSGLARYDQQLELGQTRSDCMKADSGTALRALGCCSSIIALRALCNMKFLFLESHGCYFLGWDAKGQVTVTFSECNPGFTGTDG